MSCTDFDLLSLVRPEVLILKAIGLWKSVNKNSMYNSFLYKSYRVLVWGVMILFQIFGYMSVYERWNTISVADISAVLFLQISVLNTTIATTCIYLNVHRLHNIIQLLTSEELQLKSEKHILVAKQLKISGDLLRKIYYGIILFMLVVQPVPKIALKDKEPFYPSYIPPVIGPIGILVFQEIMLVFAGYAGSTLTILDVNLMIGVSIQIEALKDIVRQSDGTNMRECIKRHKQLVRLANNVHYIISVGMSFNFVTSTILLCTTFFTLLEMEIDFSGAAFLLPYLFGIVLLIFVHCWYGSDIKDRSDEISNAIFDSKWIGANLHRQKTVFLFMTFTKQPLSIRLVGGLLTMAIPLFVSMCRSAYSFLTILQKFK